MKTVRQPESLATLWGNHIKSWKKSGQSQSTYCQEQDLSYHRFTYWRRKLAGQVRQKKKPAQRSAFIPVDSCSPVMTHSLSLTLSNGMIVQGIASGNLPVVKQLLSLLP